MNAPATSATPATPATPDTLYTRACAAGPVGMEIAVIAHEQPERIALWSDAGALSSTLTFGELNAAANRLLRRLRAAGLAAGDSVALVCANRIEFAVVRFATHRGGLRLTPVNWHLSPEDIAYVVENCEAKALFLDARAAGVAPLVAALPALRLKVAIGGEIAGFTPWAETLAGQDGSDIADPSLGSLMLYTSGTTGRPKGVVRTLPSPQQAVSLQKMLTSIFGFDPESGRDRALVTGPLYHTGPLSFCLTTPLTAGIGAVIMDKWEPERMLALLEAHGITHTFCVPTMFTRLLHLPDAVRARYDTRTLRFVIHGAAPCSVETKQQMLAWWGPILWEMFAGTEGPGTIVSPQEWIARPGTVGRSAPGQVLILDDAGAELPRGVAGWIYLRNPPGSAFKYFKDEAKTERALRGDYFTVGDIGRLDEDGYLFLTGRSAEVINSGGVKLYPQEVDDVLAHHPAVGDVACVGVPDDDWGEVIKAVVVLRQGQVGDAAMRAALIDWCEGRLAHQKWPRSIDFVEELPRSAAGKVLRSQLRSRYWAGRERQI